MDRKAINIIILFFVLGMGTYHIIPSELLIGRLIYYISLYGIITGFLFYLKFNSVEKKFKRFYLYGSIYSIGKMIYHVWVAIIKHKYDRYLIEYQKALIEYQKELINYEDVLMKYNKAIIEYKFNILGIDCELFGTIFSLIAFITLILFLINNE